MKMTTFLIAPIVAGALLLSACSGSGSPEPGSSSPQELVWGGRTETATASLDPVQANPAPQGDARLLRAVYGQLLYFDADGNRVLEHLDSIERSDDFTTWTLTLKDGIEFSDGTPFDAEALKFGLDRHSEEGSRSYVRGPMTGVEIEVTDPLTVVLTLPEANSNFDRVLESAGYIGSPTAIQADPEAFKTHPIGAGPFTVENWVVDNGMELVRNETFHGTPAPLDKVEIRTILDQGQIYNSVLTNEVTATLDVRLPEVADLVSSGYKEYEQGVSGSFGMVFQVKDAPFNDIRARQAIAYALDPQALIDVSNPGGEVSKSFFVDSPYAIDALPEMNNPKKAQDLLDELADEGKPLSFEIMSFSVAGPLTEAIQSQLSNYDNLTVTINTVDFAAMAEAINITKAYDMIPIGGAGFADPEPAIRDAFGTGGSNNKSGYSSPEMDDILARSIVTKDDDERKEVLAEFQELFAKEVLWLKISDTILTYVTAPNVENVEFRQDGVIMFDKISIK